MPENSVEMKISFIEWLLYFCNEYTFEPFINESLSGLAMIMLSFQIQKGFVQKIDNFINKKYEKFLIKKALFSTQNHQHVYVSITFATKKKMFVSSLDILKLPDPDLGWVLFKRSYARGWGFSYVLQDCELKPSL